MDIKRITPQLLDAILELLCAQCSFDALNTIETSAMCQEFDVSLEELRFVFGKLEYDGFIKDFNDRRTVFMFLLGKNVWDLLQKGGYTTQFAVAKQQLQLLEKEVAKLDKKTSLEHIERITNIIQSIYSFFPKNLMEF
ncbi:MAG: hypothetical protein COB73_00850 [Flavobacteriaceae bacterium]|nr:MAG: hypothetical protein COB73_00850 [Flavobacteriaceae bacterium]